MSMAITCASTGTSIFVPDPEVTRVENAKIDAKRGKAAGAERMLASQKSMPQPMAQPRTPAAGGLKVG